MNIKKIRAIIKKSPTLKCITCNNGLQWISTGAVIYPLLGCPKYDEHTIFSFLDESETENKHYIEFKNENEFTVNLSNYDDFEIPAVASRLSVGYGRIDNAKIFYADSKPLMVNSEHLQPFTNMDYVTFYKRGECLAVRDGMDLRAIIAPLDFGGKFVDDVEELYRFLTGASVVRK